MAPLSAAAGERAATVDLATLLKSYRVEAGLSQQQLADSALVSVQAISALERGYRKVPYRKTLERIADALGLPAQDRAALELSARRARGTRIAAESETPPHNLPRQLSAFFGRDDEVREVSDLIAATPLASLVGTGGVGKTRVAIEVGNHVLERFPEGVWFVELAPVGDPALVAGAVAATLRVPESPRRALLDTLVSYLAQKRLLIVLDNCEHVIDQARLVAGSLLRECPTVAVLATSREPLRVTGERVYRIPPLAVPQTAASPEEAMRYGAVALFVDRVRANDTRFALTHDNVEPVVEICRRLDGVPLALELAAARATVLSPRQIAERLDKVFDLLAHHDETVVPRHRTMSAVIDWSYDLLSAPARLLFDRLSIFAGGFTLEAATAVCADDNLPRADLLEHLTSLVAQSLVIVDFSRGDARYHLLEAVRQYALQRLGERGERQALSHRHALTFLDIAERLNRDWYDAPERAWLREARAELDNWRIALAWSLGERRDVRSGRLLAGALERVWYSLAPVEGRRWIREGIEAVDEATPASAVVQLSIADAELSAALGEYTPSLASAEIALDLTTGFDELQGARARLAAGTALGALSRGDEGEALLERALVSARRLENGRLQALVLGDLGTLRSRRGDIEGARRFYAEALSYYAAQELERPAASIAGHLAEVEFAAGDAAAALQRAEEARSGHEATQNRRAVALVLCNMAAYLVALDCFDDASSHAEQALRAARDVKATVLTALVLQHFAAIAALQHYRDKRAAARSCERAAMLLGFVDARLAELESSREYTERQEYDRVMASLQSALGERLPELMALGAAWKEDGAVAVALER